FAFPVTDRIAEVAVSNDIRRRMNPARLHVHDLPDVVVPCNHNDAVQLRLLDDFDSIRQLPEVNTAVRYTSGMWIIFGTRCLTVLEQRSGPGLKWNLFRRQVSR